MRNRPAVVARLRGRSCPRPSAISGGTRNVARSNRIQFIQVSRRQFVTISRNLRLIPIESIRIRTAPGRRYFISHFSRSGGQIGVGSLGPAQFRVLGIEKLDVNPATTHHGSIATRALSGKERSPAPAQRGCATAWSAGKRWRSRRSVHRSRQYCKRRPAPADRSCCRQACRSDP